MNRRIGTEGGKERFMSELMVVGFDGKYRATEVLEQIQALQARHLIELDDAVVVYRTEKGKLRVDASFQPTTREGAVSGAILGGLLGALLVAPLTAGASAAAAVGAGLASMALGVTGGTVGADEAAEYKREYGITDDFVRQVGAVLQPGQSAVFVLAHASDPAAVAERFRGYGGKVLRTTLPPSAAAKFEQLMTSPITAGH
jgi:uncharacterized membrane protein